MKPIELIVKNTADCPLVSKFVFARHMASLSRSGRQLKDRPVYLMDDEKRVCYLYNSKVACTSISVSMTGKDVKDDGEIHETILSGRFRRERDEASVPSDYWKFTFVRNPFARMYSAYENKMHDRNEKKRNYFKHYLDGYLAKDRGFENFVRKVVRIPIPLLDRHVNSQYHLIHREDGSCKVDFVGRFENLAEEYRVIQEKYGYDPLPHFNRSVASERWRDAYTEETANLVYEKFRLDFETFGYERLH